jgi:hypothetical protein
MTAVVKALSGGLRTTLYTPCLVAAPHCCCWIAVCSVVLCRRDAMLKSYYILNNVPGIDISQEER